MGTGSVGQLDTMVKCALCPEVFSSNELLQKHTTTHFDMAEKQPDDILREKLLMQTMRKKKKKKKRNTSTTTPPLGAPVMYNASTGKRNL